MSSRYSYSGISLYQTCPKQYEFANVKKLPRSISAGESFGTSVHSVMAKWGAMEVQNAKSDVRSSQLSFFGDESEEHVPKELNLESLLQLWHESFSVYGYDSKEDVDTARKRGEMCLEHVFDWWSQKERKVTVIEKGFSVSIGDTTVTGRFDRIEETEDGLHIIDFKTGSVRDQDSVDRDRQLSLYAIAAQQMYPEKTVNRLSLLFIREDGCLEVVTQRSKDDLEEAKSKFLESVSGIESGEFAALPSETKCLKCPYRRVCPSAIIPA